MKSINKTSVKNIKPIVYIFILLLVSGGNYFLLKIQRTCPKVKQISLDSAYDHFLKKDAVFVDARSRGLYRLGHIENALSIPYSKYINWESSFLSKMKKDTTMVLYCDGTQCKASDKLAEFIVKKGFVNINVLKCGISCWIDNDYPFVGKWIK